MTGVIIQARMGSTRLPGKVLMPLSGQAALWHVVRRARAVKNNDRVIVATTTLPEDDKIEAFCRDNLIDFFRGDENDVLKRYYDCAVRFGLTNIIRVTADCPLIDPENIGETFSVHTSGGYDYTTNRLVPSFPQGLDVDILTKACLDKVHRTALLRLEREHVVIYIWNHQDEFSVGEYRSKQSLKEHRWVLDWPEDYQFLSLIFQYAAEQFGPDRIINMSEVLNLLEAHPEIVPLSRVHERVPYHNAEQASSNSEE